MHTLRLDRRGLFQAGAAGAAALVAAGGLRLTEGVAAAAPLPDHLRRATWTGLGDGALELLGGDGVVPLRLTAVADLPVAASIPALRGHDGAFALRFDGPPQVEQGIHRLRHPRLGEFDLFLAPVGRDGRSRAYEAVVDRTIRIAGVNEDEPPQVVDLGVRGEQPPAGPAAVAAVGAPVAAPAAVGARGAAVRAGRRAGRRGRVRRPPARARVARATARRGPARRVVVADLALAHGGTVKAVHATLRRNGRAVARTSARPRHGRRARLRFAARRGRAFAGGRHELVVTLVARDGSHTTIRRALRVA